MNSNGFTLVELIVVISLLALLAVMIGTNMVGVQSKQQEKNYESYKNTIADAACTYIETANAQIYKGDFSSLVDKDYCIDINHICAILKKDLVSNGYLDEELKSPAGDVDNEYVSIKYVDGIKTCEYKNN